jgi:hypothetical protein
VAPAPTGRPRASRSTAVIDALGVDVDVVTDASSDWKLARGRRNFANAIARRLSTPRGGLFYDPDYGLDLREYLNIGVTSVEIANLPGEIALEVKKDPRAQTVAVRMRHYRPQERLTIDITIGPGVGPFRLIVSADEVTVELLDAV